MAIIESHIKTQAPQNLSIARTHANTFAQIFSNTFLSIEKAHKPSQIFANKTYFVPIAL
jgi:hypothetical protein